MPDVWSFVGHWLSLNGIISRLSLDLWFVNMVSVKVSFRRPSRGSLCIILVYIVALAVGSRNAFFLHQNAPGHKPSTSAPISSIVKSEVGSNISMDDKDKTRDFVNKTDRYLVFITTVFSQQHQEFFQYCWPHLLTKSKLLQGANVLIFSNNRTSVDGSIIAIVQSLFSKNPSFRLEFASDETLLDIAHPSRRNPSIVDNVHHSFQFGANEAVRLGFKNKWFSEYSWIIRINPDVFIRNSNWILQTMNDPSVDGIFVQCVSTVIHTDFFAVRPLACRSDAFDEMVQMNHERTAGKEFHHIIQHNRHKWLSDNDPSNGICRVRGRQSSVVHSHDVIEDVNGTKSCLLGDVN